LLALLKTALAGLLGPRGMSLFFGAVVAILGHSDSFRLTGSYVVLSSGQCCRIRNVTRERDERRAGGGGGD
jgi:hypothetical protein